MMILIVYCVCMHDFVCVWQGFKDEVYRKRRNEFADIAYKYKQLSFIELCHFHNKGLCVCINTTELVIQCMKMLTI